MYTYVGIHINLLLIRLKARITFDRCNPSGSGVNRIAGPAHLNNRSNSTVSQSTQVCFLALA